MENCYVFFRLWQNFSPDSDFPFGQFNSLPDAEVEAAIELYALSWLRDNKKEAKERRRRAIKAWIEALKRQAPLLTTRPTARRESTLETQWYAEPQAPEPPPLYPSGYKRRVSSKPPVKLLDIIRGPRTNSLGCRIACIAG